MKNFKNFCLSYFKGAICKRPLQCAKNYFYDFFQKNIIENAELNRLNELRKVVTDPDEIKFIDKKINDLHSTYIRNAHIVCETENKVKKLEKQGVYHESIYQAIWLKNLLKYYPNQEQFIFRDYGIFVAEFAKELNSKDEEKIIYYIDNLFNFVSEYKFSIRLTIGALKNLECKLIQGLKINHALQMGYEAYLIGSIKNDGIVAALLHDALQYSANAEKFQERIRNITKEFNGNKVLDIYTKTGQNASFQKKPWNVRKKYQLTSLNTPGTTSFSALVILLIGKKINLYEISKLFEKFENAYKLENPDANQEMIDTYMTEKKSKFWYEYSSITEDEAKKYYSDLAYVLNKLRNIPDFLFNEYEDNYLKVFGDYPIF